MRANKIRVIGIVVGMFSMVLIMNCTRQPAYSSKLLAIDRVLTTDPDSAYSLLQKINKQDTIGSLDRALYSLLYVEARDKLYYEDTIESDISEAVRIFRKEKDSRNAMRALYYKGTIESNAGKPEKAILSFLDAVDAADSSEYLYLGKIHGSLSSVYNIIDNGPMQEQEARKSLKYYEKTDSQVFINYAKLWLGTALINSLNVDEGIGITKEVLPAVSKEGNEELLCLGLRNLGDALWLKGRYQEAIVYYDSIEYINGKLSPVESSVRLRSLIKCNAGRDSIEMMASKLIMQYPTNYLPKEYYLYNDDYINAYHSIESRYKELCGVYDRMVSNETYLLAEQRMERVRFQQDLELRTTRYQLFVCILISVIILLLIAFYSKWIIIDRKRNRERLLMKSAVVSEFVNAWCAEEKKKEITLKQSLRKGKKNVSGSPYLLYSYFQQIQEFYTKYCTFCQHRTITGEAYREMDKSFKILKDDEYLLIELEEEINRRYDNLLTEVYSGMRKMSVGQRRVIAYLIFGLSPAVIAYILDVEMSAFALRKHRIKDHLKKSTCARKEKLLKLAGF